MKKTGILNGFLDQGCTIKGEVAFSDLLRIHGHVVGTVRSAAELLVGEGGLVEGDVDVARLLVAGTVKGKVKVKEKLIVHPGGKIFAEIWTPALVVEEGGVVEGIVHMANGGCVDAATTNR